MPIPVTMVNGRPYVLQRCTCGGAYGRANDRAGQPMVPRDGLSRLRRHERRPGADPLPPPSGNPIGVTLSWEHLYGPSGRPMLTDVGQDECGDCFAMASLADVAYNDPAMIKGTPGTPGMIIDNGNGTYTIRFYGTQLARMKSTSPQTRIRDSRRRTARRRLHIRQTVRGR